MADNVKVIDIGRGPRTSIIDFSVSSRCITRNNRAVKGDCTAKVMDTPTSGACGGIIADRAVVQGERTTTRLADTATIACGGIAADGAVVQGTCHCTVVGNAAAADASGITTDGAVVDNECAIKSHVNTAARGTDIAASNRGVVQRQATARENREDTHIVAVGGALNGRSIRFDGDGRGNVGQG